MTATDTPTDPIGLTDQISEQFREEPAVIDMHRERHARKLTALAELAELVEATGVVFPHQLNAWSYTGHVTATWQPTSPAAFRRLMASLRGGLTSPWAKGTAGGKIEVSRQPSDGLRLRIEAMWGSCEQVTVGTRTVPRRVEVCPECDGALDVHADGARTCTTEGCGYHLVAPKRVEREVEEPVTEWRCPDSFLDELS